MTFLKSLTTSTAALALLAGAAVAQTNTDTNTVANDTDMSVATFDYDTEFTDVSGITVAELTGTPVHLPDGERVGEIDRVGTKDGEPVLVVGIGGFLGIGEHSVAMNLDELSYDQEEAAFIVQGYSEEQLKDLPEYSEEQIAFLDNDQTLSTAWTSGMAASGTMMDDTNADHSDMAAADTMTMDETDAEASDMAAAESTMMEDTDTAESTDLTQEAQDALGHRHGRRCPGDCP